MNGSGNSYKVRVLLGLLGLPHEVIVVDPKVSEHKRPSFLKLNPRGEVPVLEDNDVVLWDSAACLVYLARQYGGDEFLPAAPAEMAQVMQWVALAGQEIQFGLQYGRRGLIQDRWTAGTLEQCQRLARVALSALEERLMDRSWLALDRLTIADIACFPYVDFAPQAAVPLDPYPAVTAWIARCQAEPGWPPR
jgi:glutathione S-transferase